MIPKSNSGLKTAMANASDSSDHSYQVVTVRFVTSVVLQEYRRVYSEEEALNERLSDYARNFRRAYQGPNTVKEQLRIDPEQLGGQYATAMISADMWQLRNRSCCTILRLFSVGKTASVWLHSAPAESSCLRLFQLVSGGHTKFLILTGDVSKWQCPSSVMYCKTKNVRLRLNFRKSQFSPLHPYTHRTQRLVWVPWCDSRNRASQYQIEAASWQRRADRMRAE